MTGALHALWLQLSPPPTSSLTPIKSILVPTYLGCPGKWPLNKFHVTSVLVSYYRPCPVITGHTVQADVQQTVVNTGHRQLNAVSPSEMVEHSHVGIHIVEVVCIWRVLHARPVFWKRRILVKYHVLRLRLVIDRVKTSYLQQAGDDPLN